MESNNSTTKETSLKVGLYLKATSNTSNTLVTLSYLDTDGLERTPVDVCCVIDISGSMGIEAKIKTGNDEAEGYGFSVLDLVKHSVRTIIAALGPQDKLAIVSFTDDAEIVMNLTKMDKTGKKAAEKAAESLSPKHSTNLWDGLYKALELFKGSDSTNPSIFLLTDGQPNVIPPRGHLPMIKRYIEKDGLSATINTFGFGYSLDSELLHDFAFEGNGAYCFIPDGSFVGTVFVNTLTNLLTTIASKIALKINLQDIELDESSPLLSNYKFEVESEPKCLNLQIGSLNLGQPKHLLLPFNFKKEPKLKVSVEYDTPYSKNDVNSFEVLVTDINDPLIEVHQMRILFINHIHKALKNQSNLSKDEISTLLFDLVATIEGSKVKDDAYIKDLLKDIKEQITLGLTNNEYYKKWGKHYIPSIVRAHLLEQCTNFKDPGLQHFGGKHFNNLRDIMDEIFLKITPPKPTHKKSAANFTGNMNTFYDPVGACFDGNCIVEMADGSLKLVKDLNKGDKIKSPNQSSQIVCVVKTHCLNNKNNLVELESGLKITPWHPIRLNGKFIFPCELEKVKEFECPAVYSFLLDSGHTMMINDVECVALAHGFQGPVVSHPYFGTEAVINDLIKCEGWDRGLVELDHNSIMRDEKNGLISKIVSTYKAEY